MKRKAIECVAPKKPAASVNEMPHMMLNSAEYWKKWLETEVDENGEELSK